METELYPFLNMDLIIYQGYLFQIVTALILIV